MFFCIEDVPVFDLGAFLQGTLEETPRPAIRVLSPFLSKRVTVSPDQLEFLALLPVDCWASRDAKMLGPEFLEENLLEELVALGLVITDREDPEEERFRKLDQDFHGFQWHPDALIFHSMTRMTGSVDPSKGLDVRVASEQAESLAAAFVEKVGPPPPAYVHFENGQEHIQLPAPEVSGGLYDELLSRRSIRRFDTSQKMDLEHLSTILKFSFGAFGEAALSPDVKLLHKTSPSGGSLHPIEAFPLVMNVRGVRPGFYHYNVQGHVLSPLLEIQHDEARQLACSIGRGQLFAGDAHVVVLLVARFFRNQWKYRRNARTYSVMMMDAGHLSQVFYLVANELNLGAFYSAAIDSSMVEETLGLNPAEYGAIGMCGCGVPGDSIEDAQQGGLRFINQ